MEETVSVVIIMLWIWIIEDLSLLVLYLLHVIMSRNYIWKHVDTMY